MKDWCHKFLYKGYEREECVNGGKERFKEMYPASVDVWIRDMNVV